MPLSWPGASQHVGVTQFPEAEPLVVRVHHPGRCEHFAEAVLDPPAGAAGDERIAATADALRKELARWEDAAGGNHLAGALSAVDLTLYPMLALATRIAGRKPALAPLAGPRLTAWAGRMAALDLVRRTWPPHWR